MAEEGRSFEYCSACEFYYIKSIEEYHAENEKKREFLREYGVLPKNVKCPNL